MDIYQPSWVFQVKRLWVQHLILHNLMSALVPSFHGQLNPPLSCGFCTESHSLSLQFEAYWTVGIFYVILSYALRCSSGAGHQLDAILQLMKPLLYFALFGHPPCRPAWWPRWGPCCRRLHCFRNASGPAVGDCVQGWPWACFLALSASSRYRATTAQNVLVGAHGISPSCVAFLAVSRRPSHSPFSWNLSLRFYVPHGVEDAQSELIGLRSFSFISLMGLWAGQTRGRHLLDIYSKKIHEGNRNEWITI